MSYTIALGFPSSSDGGNAALTTQTPIPFLLEKVYSLYEHGAGIGIGLSQPSVRSVAGGWGSRLFLG